MVKYGVSAILAVVVVIAVRHYFSPGEVVKRKLIATIEAFVEERLLALMSGISRGYTDPWGLNYETLAGYLDPTDDDIRQVNWKATARVGSPMSNTFRVEQDRQIICLIDCGRLMAAPVTANDGLTTITATPMPTA